jgi:hypothetical protein
VNHHNDRKDKAMLQPEPGRLARPVSTPPSGWQRWLPGARMLLNYEPAWLPNDVLGRFSVDHDACPDRNRIR